MIHVWARIRSHTHTNPDGSRIEIRTVNHVVDQIGEEFFEYRKGKRRQITEKEAHAKVGPTFCR